MKCTQAVVVQGLYHPRREALRLSYPARSEPMPGAPWALLRPSSMLRRPWASISERSKTNGSSPTESSSPRPGRLMDPVKLPREDCGGVCLCEGIPIYRRRPKGELDVTAGMSPSGGLSSESPCCIISGGSVLSISAAGWSLLDSLAVDSSSSCACRPRKMLRLGTSLSSAPKLMLRCANARSVSSSSANARFCNATELARRW